MESKYRTTAQIALLQSVIDWLAKGAPHVQLVNGDVLKGFDYSQWIGADAKRDDTTGACGTTGCIAGATIQFVNPVDVYHNAIEGTQLRRNGETYMTIDYAEEARDLLGLTNYEMRMLFYPFDLDWDTVAAYYGYDDVELTYNGDYGEDEPLTMLRHATPEHIAAVLQRFQDTGDIDWFILQGLEPGDEVPS